MMNSASKILLCCFVLFLAALQFAQSLPNKELKSCPENEFYTDCGENCQTECSTLGEPCYINYFRCPDGCYCDKGYARNANGKCIPIEKCPKKQ